MVFKRKQHGWTQRIGLLCVAFVFVLQTLAWSGMPMVVAGDGDHWVTICTSEGFQRVSLHNADFTADSTSPNTPRPSSVHYCDLCVFAQGLGTGFELAQIRTVRAAVTLSTATYVAALAPIGFFLPNQPRAPPFAS